LRCEIAPLTGGFPSAVEFPCSRQIRSIQVGCTCATWWCVPNRAVDIVVGVRPSSTGEERRGWCPSRSGESVGWYGDGVGEWRFGEDGKADGGVPLMLMVVTLTIPTNVAAQRTDVETGFGV
jgi:hypothetical protein